MILRADCRSRCRRSHICFMQIRHNLVVGEKPFFRRGGCVLKTAYHLEKDRKHWAFVDEAVAARFGSGGDVGVHGAQRGRMRGAVAACPRGRSHSGGAGRSCGAVRYTHQCRLAEQSGAGRRQHRGGARGGRFRSRQQLPRTGPRQEHCRQRRTVEARQRCRYRRRFGVAFRQALCHGPGDRERRRRREPVGHRCRRSLRVRRHQGRRPRRQASGDRRGGGSAGAGPGDGRPCGDRRDLRIRGRYRAGARRSFHSQGRPQGRAAGRGADAMGRPLGARGGRCACSAAGGREGFGAAARQDNHRDQGGVPRREGRRAGAAGERRRARRRKGRHPRGA